MPSQLTSPASLLPPRSVTTTTGTTPLPTSTEAKRQLTDYFPIRRSNRRTKRALEEERSCEIRRRLAKDCDDGLEVGAGGGEGG